jgi:uncharacterized protein (TIGR02058 family)
MKRFVVELGTGVDLHGQDVTKAARRAVKDAISRSCLCGLLEVANLRSPDQMRVRLQIACPFPEKLDAEAVKKNVPFGEVELVAEKGGMLAAGMHYESLGEGDKIVVALAALTVFVPDCSNSG